MLAPILDPLDRTAKFKRGEAQQNVFRVQLTAHAKAPTDMVLVKFDCRRWNVENLGELIAIPVRPLRSAMEFKNTASGVEAR